MATVYNSNIELAERRTPPLLTMVLFGLVAYFSYAYQMAPSASWLSQNIFQAYKVLSLCSEQQFVQVAGLLFKSNFATINLWQLVASLYFIALFGIPTERRLGPLRFILLIFLAGLLPWLVQFWDIMHNPVWPLPFEHPKLNTFFVGPGLIITALASAYITVVPKKKTRELYVMKTKKTGASEIFNRDVAAPIASYYGLPADVFVAVFIIYQCLLRTFFVNPWKNIDSVGLYSSLCALLIGWVLSSFVLVSHRTTFQDHPLKHKAIQHYNELLDLDVEPENAIKGAAKALGLPDEQVRLWVKQTKGKLRTE